MIRNIMANKPTGTYQPESTTRTPASASIPPQQHTAPSTHGHGDSISAAAGATPQPNLGPQLGQYTPTPPPTPGNGMAAPGDVAAQAAAQLKADEAPLSPEQSRDKVEAKWTSGATPAKPGVLGTEPRHEQHTHILVASKKEGFRRGGLTFGTKPTTVRVEDIGEEKARAIETEPMLDVQRITEEQADDFDHNRLQSQHAFHGLDPAQLRQQLQEKHEENAALRAELKRLEDKFSGTDKAPRHGEDTSDRFPSGRRQ